MAKTSSDEKREAVHTRRTVKGSESVEVVDELDQPDPKGVGMEIIRCAIISARICCKNPHTLPGVALTRDAALLLLCSTITNERTFEEAIWMLIGASGALPELLDACLSCVLTAIKTHDFEVACSTLSSYCEVAELR